MTPEAELMATSQVARLLAVTPEAVRSWVRQGRLDAVVLPSGRYRIRREDVEALLRRGDVA